MQQHGMSYTSTNYNFSISFQALENGQCIPNRFHVHSTHIQGLNHVIPDHFLLKYHSTKNCSLFGMRNLSQSDSLLEI